MEFKELYLNNELKVDEICYLDHKEYIYKGLNKEGKHIIERETKDGFELQYVSKTPKVPQLPMNTYISRNHRGKIQYGEITSCFEMLDDMYYRVEIYSDVFNGHDNESYKDLCKSWTVVEENPFMDNDLILELTDPIDDEIYKLESQIEQLKNNLSEFKFNRIQITSKCKHQWIKQEEEEVSKGKFEQECYCNKCGEEKTNYYSRLF